MSTATEATGGRLANRVAEEAGTAPGDRRFRPDVEGMRAIAVLLVVLYHANAPGLHGGFIGVDVFFVISGFVITGLLLRERTSTSRTSLVSFYGRRCRRILPAATLVIVVVVVATYVVLGSVFGRPTAVDAKWTAVFLANFHFASIGTNYLTAKLPPSPLQNFWSLAVEEQFYVVYPTVFLIVAGIRSKVSLRARLIIALVPVILGSLLLSALQTGSNPTTAFFSPFTRAWELALGALVAVATPWLLRLSGSVGAALTWVGLAAIAVAAVTYSSSSAYPGTLVIVPVVGTALIIAGGTVVPRWGAELVLRRPPFQWFGRLSYSLYLWHWPILIIAAEAAGRDSLPFHRNIGWLLLAVVAAVATSAIVENPVRHARTLARRRWFAISLGIALIATSLVVATVALDTSGPASAGSTASHNDVALPEAEVLHLVATAPGITSVPPDLSPSLAATHADWGAAPLPCETTFAQTSMPACVFGDVHGSRTMALYGDSHTAMSFDAISIIAAVSHWKLLYLGKYSCPAEDLPFDNPSGFGTPGGRYEQCDTWHQFALNRMRELHPNLVIIAQYPDPAPGGQNYSPAEWRAGLERTIKQLPDSAHATVLGNIPEHPGGGPQCLALHLHDVQACSGANSPSLARFSSAEREAATATGAKYVNTIPWFCSSTCTDVIGHFQPYWDGYHVTATYSIALLSVLAQALGFHFAPGGSKAPS